MRPVSDGLARPISFDARHGAGAERVLVLGGGGIVFVAWLTGYLAELERRGIDLAAGANRIVGTSAGSLLAAAVAGGRLRRFRRLVDLLARRPGLVARLAPSGSLRPSQQHAHDLFDAAADAQPETIRAIGAAALAAHAPSPLTLPASALLVLQRRRWPDGRLMITAVDALTGERLALTRDAGVPLLRAVAASASIPGLYAPQTLLDRRAMDGGVCGTGIHADLAAGAQRAVVLAFAATLPEPRYTVGRESTAREVEALATSGTAVVARYSRLPTMADPMDPAAVPSALALGVRQATEDTAELTGFWMR
jgi:NTE family protein